MEPPRRMRIARVAAIANQLPVATITERKMKVPKNSTRIAKRFMFYFRS
jgi:hypothetical protein